MKKWKTRETVISIQNNIPEFVDTVVGFEETESTAGNIEKIYGSLRKCGKEILYFPQHWKGNRSITGADPGFPVGGGANT